MRLKRLMTIATAAIMLIVSLPVLAEDTQAEKTFYVANASPSDGARNLSPVNLKIELEFTEAPDAATLNSNNISVTKNALASVVVTGEKKATVYLKKSAIELGGTYTVTLKNGIKSVSGKSLEETKISFGVSNEYPRYRQMSNADMSDVNDMGAYVGDQFVGYTYDGDNSVLVLKPDWAQATVRQRVYLEPGTTYTARAKVKSNVAQEIWFALPHNVPGDADYYKAGSRVSVPAGQWTKITYTWSVPANVEVGSNDLRIAAGTMGSTVWIDDWEFFAGNNDKDDPTASVSAENDGFTVVSESDNVLEKMKAFGVISSGVSAKANISRMELAKSMLRILNIDENSVTGVDNAFTDVDTNDAAMVAAVKQLGIMKGYSDTVFAPDEAATAEQVLKTLMIAMGYDVVAYGYGGYSDGYVRMAQELGVLKGVSAAPKNEISAGDFAKILDNALDKEVLEVKNYDFSTGTELGKGAQLMEVGLALEEGKGMIEGTNRTYLYQKSSLKENQVCINGEIFECDADLNPYLGAVAKFWYKTEDDIKRIVYITGMADMNEIAEFSSFDDRIEYSANVYTHTDANNRKETYYVEKDKNVIYNGKYAGAYTNDIFTPDYGSVRLIASEKDYDTVIITDIKTVFVQAIDANNMTVYDSKYTNGFKFNDCDILEIYDKDGFETDFGSIKVGNVLSVMQSLDGTIAKIYVSSDEIKGSVATTVQCGEEYEVGIGDLQYGANVRRGTVKTIPKTVDMTDMQVGNEGIFYLDYRGRLAAFSTASAAKKIGYLVDAATNNNGIGARTQFKIYDESGMMLYFDGAEKVKVDQTMYKNAADVIDALKKGTDDVVSQLVVYDTNSEGKLSFIDTAYNKLPNCEDYRLVTPEEGDSEDGFKVTYSSILPPNAAGTEIQFAGTGRTFGQKVQLSSKPKIFIVPLDSKNDDEEKYTITGDYWTLGNEYSSSVEAYQVDRDTFETEYLVVYLGEDNYHTNANNGWSFGIVKDIKSVVKDEVSVVEISLTDGRNIYTDKPDYAKGIKIGDFIQWKANVKSFMISKANVFFDIETKQATANPYGSITSSDGMYYVNVHEKKGGVLKVTLPTVAMDDAQEVALNSLLIDASRAAVWVYDAEQRERIQKATINDVLDYVNAGNDYSKLLIVTTKGYAKQILIVK